MIITYRALKVPKFRWLQDWSVDSIIEDVDNSRVSIIATRVLIIMIQRFSVFYFIKLYCYWMGYWKGRKFHTRLFLLGSWFRGLEFVNLTLSNDKFNLRTLAFTQPSKW